MIPKTLFNVLPVKYSMDIIHHFLNPEKGDWDWSTAITSEYPQLGKKLKNIKSRSKREKITEEYLNRFEKKNWEKLEKANRRFLKSWSKVNDKALQALEQIIEVKWPKKDKEIKAFTSLNPINPRFIKERNFSIYYKYSSEKMKATAVHEILHFLYFVKWKKVFPKTSEKQFDSPYLVWELSEMVPRTILSDKRMQKIIPHNPRVYGIYQRNKIKGRPLLDYIQEFYDNRRNFTDFLKKSYAFVKKHQKEIGKFK